MKIKYIDVKCPALVNFYYNIENSDIVTVNDNIDLCDEVDVSVDNRYDTSRIYLNNKLLLGDNLIIRRFRKIVLWLELINKYQNKFIWKNLII